MAVDESRITTAKTKNFRLCFVIIHVPVCFTGSIITQSPSVLMVYRSSRSNEHTCRQQVPSPSSKLMTVMGIKNDRIGPARGMPDNGPAKTDTYALVCLQSLPHLTIDKAILKFERLTIQP